MSHHKVNNPAKYLFADRTDCTRLQNVRNSEFERKKAFNKVFLRNASSPSYM